MAALVRFELTMMESESTALPLGYGAILEDLKILNLYEDNTIFKLNIQAFFVFNNF